MRKKCSIGKLICIYALFVLAGICFFFLNMWTPMLSDDAHFLFVWSDYYPIDEPVFVNNFSDVITSCANYYNFSGGRIVCHFFAFLFASMDRSWFVMFNTVIFCAFLYLLFRLFTFYLCRLLHFDNIFDKLDDPKVWWTLLIGLISLFLFVFSAPVFGEVYLWLSGAINYLWTGTLLLLCIDLFLERFNTGTVLCRIGILFLFFISASTNEVTGGILFVFLCLQLFSKQIRFDKWIVFYFLSLLPGMLLILLAPGNVVRYNIAEHGKFDTIRLFLAYLCSTIVHYAWLVISVIFVACVLFFVKHGFKIKEFLSMFLLFICGMCGICALALSGSFSVRAMSMSNILFFPIGAASISWVVYECRVKLWFIKLLSCFVFFGRIAFFGLEVCDYYDWAMDLSNVESQIIENYDFDNLTDLMQEAIDYNKRHYCSDDDSVLLLVPREGELRKYTMYWLFAISLKDDREGMRALAEYILNNEAMDEYKGVHHLCHDSAIMDF